MYTVKEVANLANISVRTLHHYDSIGLLRPAYVGENQYRYYGEPELLRLQQILFYREFGVSLGEIARYLDDPDFDHVGALNAHRRRLQIQAERYHRLIQTIDHTIARLTGERITSNADLYKGFSPEKQREYEAWLVEQYGPAMLTNIAKSQGQLAKCAPEEMDARMVELAEIERALADQLAAGISPLSEDLRDLLEQHRDWIGAMWGGPCSLDAYAGVAEMYLSHPDFKTRYETIALGFTDFLTTAMKAHAQRR